MSRARNIYPTDIKYRWRKGYYVPNLDRDYQLFVIWENARFREEEIIGLIRSRFIVKKLLEVTWDDENKVQSLRRLYGELGAGHVIGNKFDYVGYGSFVVVVVEDRDPKYIYRQNINGNVVLVNSNVTRTKDELRSMVGGNFTHSTDNPQEFNYQYGLLVGLDQFIATLNSENDEISNYDIHGNMVGNKGYKSFDDLVALLNLTCDYAFISIMESDGNKRITVLVPNANKFIAVINPCQIEGSKCKVVLDADTLLFDIVAYNDESYESKWKYDMLMHKEKYDSYYRISKHDYFMMTVYDYLFSADSKTSGQIEDTITLSDDIGYYNFDRLLVRDKLYIYNVLKGYFNENMYGFCIPSMSHRISTCKILHMRLILLTQSFSQTLRRVKRKCERIFKKSR